MTKLLSTLLAIIVISFYSVGIILLFLTFILVTVVVSFYYLLKKLIKS